MGGSFTPRRCVQDDSAARQFQGPSRGAGTGPRGALVVPSLAFSLSVHRFCSFPKEPLVRCRRPSRVSHMMSGEPASGFLIQFPLKACRLLQPDLRVAIPAQRVHHIEAVLRRQDMQPIAEKVKKPLARPRRWRSVLPFTPFPPSYPSHPTHAFSLHILSPFTPFSPSTPRPGDANSL